MCAIFKTGEELRQRMFEIIAKEGRARSGILHTRSYAVHTPAFMPVNTKAAAKFVTARDLVEMDVQAIICNAFILYLKPGLKKAGDIHEFMHFKRAVFTDCGAFQMLKESFFIGYTDHGIRFKDPFSGKPILLTPRDIMKIQTALNSDVAMALDNLPRHTHSREEMEDAVKMTIEWHKTSKEVHDSLWEGKKEDERQRIFGIGQGGYHEDLRKSCLRELLRLDFDGYALGGLCIGEDKKHMPDMIRASKEVIPEDKPVYLMGVGSPEDILDGVAEGVDIFDSAYPTMLARHSQIFTWDGYLNLKTSKFSDDERPLDPHCDCFVCKNHTRKYIYHVSSLQEPTAHILKSYHNLYFLQALVKRCRTEIEKGTFGEFRKGMKEKYGC
jgi:queuine tRNA-ribosyltransferase